MHCPHTSQPGASPATCSLCLGATVERVAPPPPESDRRHVAFPSRRGSAIDETISALVARAKSPKPTPEQERAWIDAGDPHEPAPPLPPREDDRDDYRRPAQPHADAISYACAARELGVSRSTISAYVHVGALARVARGYVTAESVEAYAARRARRARKAA